MPLTILPGIIQLARSPFCATCIAPRIDRSMCPPRIIVNESALEKYDVVGGSVIVCLPALMRSGSSRVHTGGANTGTGGELPVGVGDHDRSAFVTTHQNVDPRIVERIQHGTC